MCNFSHLDLFWDVTEICNKKKPSDQLVMEKAMGKICSFEAEKVRRRERWRVHLCLSRQLSKLSRDGLRWFGMDSDGFRWIQMDLDGEYICA